MSLRYPNKQIESTTDYLKIDVLQYEASGFTPQKNVLSKISRASDKTKKILNSVYLPIPQGISDNNMTGWGDDSLNTLAAYAVGATADIIKPNSNFFENLMNAGGTAFNDLKQLAGDGSALSMSNAFFGSKAANLFGGQTSFEGLLARSTGQILNPNTELLFNGIKLRSFNFIFDLAPRDLDESQKVKDIIRLFKKNMSPTTTTTEGGTQGLFLKSPNVFKLQYMTGSSPHQFLHKFKLAALTNMQVNYTGSGTYMTYNDPNKTPVHMKLSLSFQELDPVYSEDYDSKEGNQGVGF